MTAEEQKAAADALFAALVPFAAFSRAMTDCLARRAPLCRTQQRGRDCLWQQGWMTYSEYAPQRMCEVCALAWYARSLGLEIEDHLRHSGFRPSNVAGAVNEATIAQARIVDLEQLVHDVDEAADAVRRVLGPRCVRAPGNCRRMQAENLGRATLLIAEVNAATMCRPCALVWLADMAAQSARRTAAGEPPALDPPERVP